MVIGNYCSFATGVQFIPDNHPIQDVSTHPFFHRPEFGFVKKEKDNKSDLTIVGHDVWIGKNAIILPNCKKIGNGAIIGAGAVVTHDVEPYSIVAGNPAKLIRKRFDDNEIELLEKSKWYELSPSKLRDSIKYKNNISKFVESLNNKG
jgi:acetyltransferase-like isoleucine patch superfamily enzyme